jgi:hypothetical protein
LSASGNLRNSALIGLLGGLSAAGLYLLISAARAIFFAAPCDPGDSGCALEREIALHVARRQTLVGGALLLLTLALLVRFRAKLRASFKPNGGQAR